MAAEAAAPPAGDLDALAKLAREQARAVLRKLPLLGPITWLMLQQAPTRHLLLADLEWRVMPPLALDQLRLHLRDEAPLGFLSWASLSADAAARYRQPPHRLVPADWKSGDEIWIVDLVAPFGGAAELVADFKRTLAPGRAVQQLAGAGAQDVRVLNW